MVVWNLSSGTQEAAGFMTKLTNSVLDTLSLRHGDSQTELSVRRDTWVWKSGESFTARKGSWCPSAVHKGGSVCAGGEGSAG